MAKYEKHPYREGVRHFGKAAVVIGGLAVGAVILS
jgi:hypothetical protein